MARAISILGIAIMLILSLSLVACPPPARGAQGVIYVQERVGGWFDPAIRSAINLVDEHTSSDMKLVGTCPPAGRCFRFHRKKMKCCHGLTSHRGKVVDIYLNPDYSRDYRMAARVTLVAHELGHAFGLGHGPRGSVMYAYAPELGLTPRTFTISEREYLRLR